MVIKVLDSSGAGLASVIASGIDYAVRMGAKIINCSVGSPKAALTEYNSIKLATEKNATIVSGTGNDNSRKIYFPAAYEEVIAVGGSGPDDRIYVSSETTGSNYVPQIDIVAPGSYIFILIKRLIIVDTKKVPFYWAFLMFLVLSIMRRLITVKTKTISHCSPTGHHYRPHSLPASFLCSWQRILPLRRSLRRHYRQW